MKKLVKRLLGVGVLLILCFSVLQIRSIEASAIRNQGISIKYYVMLLEKAMGIQNSNPMKMAIKIGLVKEGEFDDALKPVTNEQAAVLVNRADIIKNGKKALVEKQYIRATKNMRISDFLDIAEEYREEVYQTFVKGIMIGESNGMYSQSRKFFPKRNLLRTEAFVIVKRFGDLKKRKEMSPDGQLIRTTNLPKNYNRFDYVLESFPNSFYEMKFMFERAEYSFAPREFIEYTYPNRIKNMPYINSNIQGTVKQHNEMIEKYLDEWCQQIQKNLYYRFNVNYKIIDDKWVNNLRNTYVITGIPDYDKRDTSNIKEYVNKVKNNQIIIQSNKIVIEPSTLYCDGSYYKLRCYVKFRIVSCTNKLVADNIFYTFFSNISGLEKNKWMERYFDVAITPASNNSYGEGYYLSGYDELLEWKDSVAQ